MVSRIHQKLGTAGFIISIVALVAALTGGAYAAAGLNSTQKNQVRSIAKSEAKKFANSNPGAPGATGAPGAPGAAGKNGTNGTNGAPGANGNSVVVGTPTVGECAQGGATVQVATEPATKKAVCNGQTGFTSTLPAGKTETGTWSTVGPAGGIVNQFMAFSFPIPIATDYTVNFIDDTETAKLGSLANCTGGTAEAPKANPGNLCIFANAISENLTNVEEQLGPEARTDAGVVLTIIMSAGGFQFGTWALTAPTA